jgi:hypothetical protein
MNDFLFDIGTAEPYNGKTLTAVENSAEEKAVDGAFDILNRLAERLDGFLKADDGKAEVYAQVFRSIFTENLKVQVSDPSGRDPVFALLDWMESTDFFRSPASTKYHGAKAGGLARHALFVCLFACRLAPVMLPSPPDPALLAESALFHDLCKADMYEVTYRNVKNEATGVWEKAPRYVVRHDYLVYGHGIESLLRIEKFLKLPECWRQAVRWHMGAYDISQSDGYALDKALGASPEVLLLQTADMMASRRE